MIKNKIDRGEVLQSQLFNGMAGLEHFCTMRSFQEPCRGVWMPRQVHGTNIVIVDADTPCDSASELQPVEADAVITCLTDRWIGVRTADCVPVLIADPVHHAIAAIHAGWRGTVAHIVQLTIRKMIAEVGCNPQEMLAMVGPSISPESFEVGEEVAEAFVAAGRGSCVLRELWSSKGRQALLKPHVDLWQSNVMDMLEEGIELGNIDCTPLCTYQNYEDVFSARREGIGTGRIVSAIRWVK